MILMTGYFKLARNVSKLSDHKVKVGAVIVNKKPVSACSNKAKTHPTYANPDKGRIGSLHAEIRCLINCEREDLTGAIIYVYREVKGGRPALARPCSACLGYLKEAGVKKMIYTINEYPYYQTERL